MRTRYIAGNSETERKLHLNQKRLIDKLESIQTHKLSWEQKAAVFRLEPKVKDFVVAIQQEKNLHPISFEALCHFAQRMDLETGIGEMSVRGVSIKLRIHSRLAALFVSRLIKNKILIPLTRKGRDDEGQKFQLQGWAL